MSEVKEVANRRVRLNLESMQRRRDFLAERIKNSPIDLSYDKQECSALGWAIAKLKSYYGIAPEGE